jgi:nitric oxide reductase NorD protein
VNAPPRDLPTRYRSFLAELANHTPDLSGFFHNTAAYLAPFAVPEEEAFESLRELTLASETVFIDVGSVLPRAVARGELLRFSTALHRLARASTLLARTFHAGYPSLQTSLESIEGQLVDLASAADREGSAGAEKALAFCLGIPDAAVARFLFERFALIARHSPALLGELTASLGEKLSSLRWPVFAAWLQRGTELLDSGREEEGVRHLELRSRESRLLLGLRHAVLDDVGDVLRIYCASLDGVSLGVSSVEASAFGIAGPHTDGKTLFLPPEVRAFEDAELNARAYTVLAAVLASSVKMGTFGFALSSVTFGDELRNRYGTLLPEIMPNVRRSWAGVATAVREPSVGTIEIVFASGRVLLAMETELEKLFYSYPTPGLARELFTLAENARIAWRLGARYPGLREDLAMLDRYLWERRPPVPAPEDRVSTLRSVLEQLIRFSLRGDLSRSAPALGDALAPACRALEGLRSEGTTVQDSAEVAFRVYNLFFDRYPVSAFCDRHPPAELFAGAHKQLFYPELVREVSPELLAAARERPRYDDLEAPQEEEIDLTSLSARDAKAQDLARAVASGGLKAFRYPEYNVHKGAYEPAHCTLFERLLTGSVPTYYQRVLAAHEAVHKRIRKKFLAMRPEEVEISRRWLSGDDVNLTDAVDFAIEMARGQCPDEKVYYRKVQNRRDIVVAILVDASSSTDEVIPGGRGEGRRVIDVETESLALLASALHLLGDSFGMFSYFSLGRRRVFFNVIKDFQESWSPAAQARIPSVEAYAANRDGCAIRHVTTRLLERPEKTRLLILLSDGIPADVGYGGKTAAGTSHYAIEDTRRAIAEARAAGIVPYCITIDRFAKRYIPHLYGEWSYTILPDVALLPERLTRLYLKLTR